MSGQLKDRRQTYELTLVENGLDFIESGIAHFMPNLPPDGRRQKYALLHIFAGTLLLLKERLAKAHPSFVFVKIEDVAKPDPSACKTVDFDTAITRLQTLAKVVLSEDDQKLLRRAQQLRNQMEHSHFALQVSEAEYLVGKLIEFVHAFLRDQLGLRLEEKLSMISAQDIQRLEGVAKRIDAERNAARIEREAYYAALTPEQLLALRNSGERDWDPELFECQACGSQSAIVDDLGLAPCTEDDCRAVEHARRCEMCGGECTAAFCNDCQGDIERHRGD